MSINRREFITSTLCALAASRSVLRAQGNVSSIDVYFKGQFLPITQGRDTYLCCLDDAGGHVAHPAMMYVPVEALAPDAPDGHDNAVGGWRGWRLAGNVGLRNTAGGAPRGPVGAGPGSAKAVDVPWPEPVNDDAKWNDRAYIPQLATIVPGCSLKPNWRSLCKGMFGPFDRARLRPHKPCKSEDAVAVWVWRQQAQATHVRSASDLLSIRVLEGSGVLQPTLGIGDLSIPLRVDAAVQIAAICAPARTNPPSRKSYAVGNEVTHFQDVYRVVNLNGATPARMYYAMQSADAGTVQGTVCLRPFTIKDDDIFCPGAEPPPG